MKKAQLAKEAHLEEGEYEAAVRSEEITSDMINTTVLALSLIGTPRDCVWTDRQMHPYVPNARHVSNGALALLVIYIVLNVLSLMGGPSEVGRGNTCVIEASMGSSRPVRLFPGELVC